MFGSGSGVGDNGDVPGSRGLAVAGGPVPESVPALERGPDEMNPASSQILPSAILPDWTDAGTLEPPPEDTGAVRRSRWLRQYQGGLLVADLVTAWVAVGIAYLLRFGTSGAPAPTVAVAAVLPLAWVALIGVNHGYHPRLVGVGAAEFQKIFRAFLRLAALISFTSYVTHADLARGFVLVALPLALVLNLVARYAARKWLHAQRARGRALKSVLLVGDAEAISKFSMVLRRDQYAGMRVAGACVPSELVADMETIDILAEADVPLLGDVDSIVGAVRLSGADTVAVVSSGALGPEKLRWVS